MNRSAWMRDPAAVVATALLLVSLGACAPAARVRAPHEAFWAGLQPHCGRSYLGTVVEAPANDTVFAGKTLVMHVRECGDTTVRIPFHVGENRSRTWVVTRSAEGLRLKHDHRHEDGHPDSITWYGGHATAPADSAKVEFPADEFTAKLLPAATRNIWTIELEPRQKFVYALRREGTDRRFRIEFDLTKPVANPPPTLGRRALIGALPHFM